jgi:hypothetical protein
MRLHVEIEDGKYTVIQEDTGTLHALRYGEPWRDLCGDKLVYCLAAEVEALRDEVKRLERDNSVLQNDNQDLFTKWSTGKEPALKDAEDKAERYRKVLQEAENCLVWAAISPANEVIDNTYAIINKGLEV